MMKKIGIILILYVLFHSIIVSLFKIDYTQEIKELCKTYGVEEDLILSIIKVESNFREKIVSHKGAVGLMQVMPSTAEWILEKEGKDFAKFDLYNARDNIEVGMIYYSYLSKKFRGNITQIMIAYNAGASRVYDNSWKEIKETREYVFKIQVCRVFYKYRLFVKKILN
jgi:soluble lytic murein transglycosylase